MEIKYFVYILTFSNGKIYVGMSQTDKRGLYTLRYNNHSYHANKGKKTPLYNAWRKYGAPSFFVISEHNDRESCANAEIEEIAKRNSTDHDIGYNITSGGEGNKSKANPRIYALMHEKVWSNPIWKKKVSDALKGRPVSENTTEAYKQWCKDNPELKAEAAKKAWRDPAYKATKSEATRLQMQNGGSLHLSKMFKGRSDARSAEGKESQRQKMKEYTKTEEGRAALKRGYEAWKSNPENLIKNRIALDAWRESDANKEQCKRMAKLSAAKCSIKVRDNETGIVYNSQHEMAKALGVTDAAITNRVKKGKATRL